MNSHIWLPGGWRTFPVSQQPQYEDEEHLRRALRQIGSYPPLVFVGEVDKLKSQIADAAQGKKFILHGGDCAERFIDCNEAAITNKIKIILQMSVILTYGARKPVIRIGRIAGQYSKPRTSPTELINGVRVPIYRGDSVNDYEPVPEKRRPDPERLVQAYFMSVATLNYIRAMIAGGFADLHNPYSWNLHSIEQTTEGLRFKETVDGILDAINFMESFGGLNRDSLGTVDFFISHEGLLLEYEEALTRRDPSSGKFYNLGTHMLWLGERTRLLNEAHVEYFRGIANPIGVKVGPSMDPEELISLIDRLNPQNEEGRIKLIARMGSRNIEERLPVLVSRVKKSRLNVTWSCDPMHGNMCHSANNCKTRKFDDILNELSSSFRILSSERVPLGGVHFELTGDDVTECLGGATAISDEDLSRNYQSYCDPRLNYNQSLEMAFLISELLNRIAL
jgi:3-deoxy-7-phosphoheptulonate synthase